MNQWIQFSLVSFVLIALLQVNMFVVAILQSKGNPLTKFPLSLMLRIYKWSEKFDDWLGRILRGYGKFVDEHGWEIAERTFKILGWILIAGTIRAISHISDHWLLRGLSIVIFGILGWTLTVPASKIATATQQWVLSRSRKSVLTSVLFPLLVWLLLLTVSISAISLLVDDITNYLPPTSKGAEDSVN